MPSDSSFNVLLSQHSDPRISKYLCLLLTRKIIYFIVEQKYLEIYFICNFLHWYYFSYIEYKFIFH